MIDSTVRAYEEMIKYHTKLRNWSLVEIYFRMLGNILGKKEDEG